MRDTEQTSAAAQSLDWFVLYIEKQGVTKIPQQVYVRIGVRFSPPKLCRYCDSTTALNK